MKTLFAILILIISFQSRCFAINIVTSLNGGNCSLVTAENNTILNQNESLIVKSLTKTTKTKKIFIREEIDGFRYFLLQDKYGLIGIADLEGKLIIPIENKAIYYFPALSKGYCNIEYIDEKSTIRKSHENPILKKIYKEYLGKPGSELAEKLLHTTYEKREKYMTKSLKTIERKSFLW